MDAYKATLVAKSGMTMVGQNVRLLGTNAMNLMTRMAPVIHQSVRPHRKHLMIPALASGETFSDTRREVHSGCPDNWEGTKVPVDGVTNTALAW